MRNPGRLPGPLPHVYQLDIPSSGNELQEGLGVTCAWLHAQCLEQGLAYSALLINTYQIHHTYQNTYLVTCFYLETTSCEFLRVRCLSNLLFTSAAYHNACSTVSNQKW